MSEHMKTTQPEDAGRQDDIHGDEEMEKDAQEERERDAYEERYEERERDIYEERARRQGQEKPEWNAYHEKI